MSLFEEHPEWVLRLPARPEDLSRNQLVLDLTNPKVQDFVFGVVDAQLSQGVGYPASVARCESTSRVKNFEMAARQGKFATTFPFDDTAIYKTSEGASYSLSVYPDKKLEA